MRKFINQPENVVAELLEGLALANADIVELTEGRLIVNKALKEADRATIVSLSGSGHEPGLVGFVGEGMLDVAVPGDIFAAPGPEACLEAIKLADRGKGVLLVVFNHPGDILTAEKTMELARQEGINVVKAVVQEDVSNAPRSRMQDRRGLVGGIVMLKLLGAAAREGKSLSELKDLAQGFIEDVATLAVATQGATHPVTGRPISDIEDGHINFGLGQHGEKGGFSCRMLKADDVADKMANILMADLNLKRGEDVMVVVNGLGSTTMMELFIIFRRVSHFFKEKGIRIAASWIDEILTVQEAAGFQICFARMNAERLRYWNAPCRTTGLIK
jgi:dihydroxyacetone kinase-like protein